eukprot:12186123-Alexandrium_andersonii.AAC.1
MLREHVGVVGQAGAEALRRPSFGRSGAPVIVGFQVAWEASGVAGVGAPARCGERRLVLRELRGVDCGRALETGL